MKFIISILTIIFLFAFNVYAGTSASNFYIDKNVSIKNDVHLSKIIELDYPMDRAVLSWNASTPENSYIELVLRAKAQNNGWSKWFKMGIWGENIESQSIKGQENDFGKVDIDTLELKEPAKGWQYKIILHAGKNKSKPIIHSVALTTKNSKVFKKDLEEISGKVRPLKVPKLSQFESTRKADKAELGNRICSPTSVTMLLKYNGIANLSPLDIASDVYDHGADVYGNWPFNTATIFNHLNSDEKPSFTTYVRWYESFNELMNNVRKGEPVIVSIGFKDGELKGAPKPTPGHLVLVRGVDNKYVYVNDPAAPNEHSVGRKYSREEFTKAWKGIAYVVERGED